MAEHGQHLRGRALAPAVEPRDPVRRIADEREQVGNDCRHDAELRADARLVERDVLPAVPLDDARADHALAHVLVDRADPHLLDALVRRRVRGRRRDRIIGLELDHRPDLQAERRRRTLGERELRDQPFVEALAGLVAGEQVVAERFDHVVERDAAVRDLARAQQHRERAAGTSASRRPRGPRAAAAARRTTRGTARTSRRTDGPAPGDLSTTCACVPCC